MILFSKKAFLFLKYIFYTYLCVFMANALFLLMKSDISLQSPKYSANQDYGLDTYKHRPPVYLISYADGPEVFFMNQSTLSYSALNKGIDHIFQFRRGHIDPEFYKKNEKILEAKYGAGYWLWKPYFIGKMLREIPENSLLIYADSGLIFFKPITKILELCKNNDILLLQDGDPRKGYGTIGKATKRELLQLFDMDTPAIRQQPGNWACLYIFKNTPRARKFVNLWLEVCQNPKALDPTLLNPSLQHQEFRGHAPEQSVAGLIGQQMKKEVLFIHGLRDFGIQNVHRHSDRQFMSVLPYIFRSFKISEFTYDLKIIQEIRRIAHDAF